MLKKILATSLLASAVLYADMLGGEISVGVYSHSPSGSASYTLTGPLSSTVDLEDDFGWSDDQNLILKAYFEHPLPFLPNMKIAYSTLNQSGTGDIENFSWGPIQGDGNVDSELEVQMYDLTVYYELLDNIVELDTGLTLRYLGGDITVTPTVGFSPIGSLGVPYTTDIDLWIPMVYGKARFNIPNTDISLQFEGNGISYQDTEFYDYELSARYVFFMGLGLEKGYKSAHLKSKDLEDGLVVDVDFSGPYASIVWDF